MNQTVFSKVKSNKAFMILSALGILFVVDAHASAEMGAVSALFPYNSFFMPMFMFISGYFWKEKIIEDWCSAVGYLKNKFEKLMVPYLLWGVFYWLLMHLLNGLGLNWPRLTVRDFVYSVMTDGTTCSLNGAAWFVPTLFAVVVTYTVLRKLARPVWNDTAMLIVFVILGAGTVALTQRGVYHKALLLYKTGFFIQFFHLGFYFRHRLEKWFDSVNGLGMCAILAVINMLLQLRYDSIAFGRCAFMSDFESSNHLLPLITSVTGIFFWLKVAKFTEPILGNSRLVNYISDNTFFIMMHHLAFVSLFSGALMLGMKAGIPALSRFDAAAFLTDPWYTYGKVAWVRAAYFLFAITATLLACKLCDRAALCLKKIKQRSTSSVI